ncbi:hypothetical protein PITCH_A1010014 [uncultured Desulfobacterium sp.]|uniref:Uncharacterized protein n=1 Tax=uncultured Desulfobacterium sp. TaxID=201089 RepID=A0A445MQK7_9BACT|nr:hypothetical protein PITCH_A1010014 [uncultured Desulfobacterium sp.]
MNISRDFIESMKLPAVIKMAVNSILDGMYPTKEPTSLIKPIRVK